MAMPVAKQQIAPLRCHVTWQSLVYRKMFACFSLICDWVKLLTEIRHVLHATLLPSGFSTLTTLLLTEESGFLAFR